MIFKEIDMNKNGVWSCDLCVEPKKYNHLLVVTNEDRNPPGVYTTPVRADICLDCWKMVVDKMIGAGWARRNDNE